MVQWAQEHGEVGGVLASHAQLTAQLRAAGHPVTYVDTGSPRRALGALPRAVRRRGLHLLHITRLWRAIVLAPVFALLPGRTALVLHSGSVARQLERMSRRQRRVLRTALRAYDEIWPVNDEIALAFEDGPGRPVRVITPFSAEAAQLAHPPAGDSPAREPHLLSVATNAGLAHYNADLAVRAAELVRETWPDATLRVLAYGHAGPELAELRAAVAGLPWVELSFDASPSEVHDVLLRSAVFLRPTAWDGDSVIVREALGAGARVVATDTAPRPVGVELASPDAADLARAVVEGGRPSDGGGLTSLTAFDAALDALGRLS